MKCILCVYASIRLCVMQISIKLLHFHVFGKFLVLMGFFFRFLGPSNFFRFLDVSEKLSEY